MFEDAAKKSVTFQEEVQELLIWTTKHYGPSFHYYDKAKQEQIYSLSDIWKISYFLFTKKHFFHVSKKIIKPFIYLLW